MKCSRCRGLMVEVEGYLLDFEGISRHIWAINWRCVTCGHGHDSVIEQNRLARQEQVVVLPSGEPDYQDDEVHLGVESFTCVSSGLP